MGEHINQIHKDIEKIERNLNEMKNEHMESIGKNKNELKNIKGIMVYKSEFNDFFQELNNKIKEPLPSLITPTLEKTIEEENHKEQKKESIKEDLTTPPSEQKIEEENHKDKKIESIKEEKKKRFRFLSGY